MLKVYRNTSILILLIIIGIQWGFYQPYTSQFPNFIDKTVTIHIHGALLMSWMVLLIIQPLLIQSGKAQLHRTIGKVSYVLGPLVILMLFLVGRGSFLRHTNEAPVNDLLAAIVLDMRGWISFAIFWALAMLYRKDSGAHMRYMIATGVIGVGPGVGRGLISSFGLDIGLALTITDIISLAIVGFLLGYDVYKKKNYKASLIITIVFLIGGILWQIRDTEVWRSFAKAYAGLFY